MADANVNNSSLRGNFLRMTGYTCAATGAVSIFNGVVDVGIGAIVLGLIVASWGNSINEKKRFNIWKQNVEAKNLVPAIRQDMSTAIKVYNTYPNKKTLEYIRTLNPQAAANIDQQLAARNQKK